MRYFNTEGSCRPEEHYMVRLDDRLEKIKTLLVDRKKYFIINRGRQYGKTTTLRALEDYIKDEYIVLSLDFQGVETDKFVDAATFAHAFARELIEAAKLAELEDRNTLLGPLIQFAGGAEKDGIMELFVILSRMCREAAKPVVLMIDEVDSASNNQVFVDFLSILRKYYLNRDKSPIFHAVILAGVYDIKNLKLKLRPDIEHQYNSPWNIAAKFKVDMNFSADQIAFMLSDYEADYHTGMEIQRIAQEIYQYTSGYPVLVSAICKYIDEDILEDREACTLSGVWTCEGVRRAVKAILIDDIPLFGSMIRHINEYPDMKKMFHAILFQGSEFAYNPDTKEINLACMFGYAADRDGKVQIANRIFETRLYNYFLSEEEMSSVIGSLAKRDRGCFIHDGMLDMDIVMKKFVEHFSEIYGEKDAGFVEKYGRKIFLLYLKPIINGVGNYYIEAQTRDERRTDVIVDYLGEQFIIELKIWHGREYNERGKRQLMDYLAYYNKDKGYMLSFNFNKNKKSGVSEMRAGGKTIIEAVV
ncbi:hypothetical protein IMSAGC009_00440 [Lachnospiraceae bacterium]|nr:hypothetical protein IMSAGC009_00440 [Lachnospiraceae bacterium]